MIHISLHIELSLCHAYLCIPKRDLTLLLRTRISAVTIYMALSPRDDQQAQEQEGQEQEEAGAASRTDKRRRREHRRTGLRSA